MKDLSFVELYERSLLNNYDRTALTDYGTNISFTYGDVAKEILKLHIFFKEAGIKPGDKIALIGKNNTYWCVAYLSIATYGAVVVPILNDFNPNDIHHIINHSESTLLFVSDTIWEALDKDKIADLRGAFSLTDLSLLYKKEDGDFANFVEKGKLEYEKKYPEGVKRENIRFEKIPNDQLMVLNYTSGTTGFTKGVMISGSNLTGNLAFAHKMIPLNAGDNIISFLPLAHTYGAAFEFLFPFMEGCHITLLGKTPTPQVLLKAFSEIRPVLVISVPLILEKIYRKMLLPVLEKKTMRIALKIPFLNTKIYSTMCQKLVDAFGGNFSQIVIGGAPLNFEVEEFLAKIKFPYTVGYGMTECAPLISFALYNEFVPHSCGKALDVMEIRIDSNDPENEAGEIQVRGQNVMLGYYKNEEATQAAFTDDGWLKTGDLGTLDKDKNLFIRGRLKSLILNATGQNIYPEEIEAKLDNLPFVMESVVVQRENKLIALVYPDYDTLKLVGLNSDNLAEIMTKNKETLNNMVATYEKIAEIQLHPTEFEKTPKKSIKRFLYS